VSQPCDKACKLPAPGKIDASLDEFWDENPWTLAASHNLSSFERDRMFLNVGGKAFLEISHLSGADNEGDGRCAVAADFFNTGRMDLLVRQVGGGPLVLYENRFPQKHFLKVSLRGRNDSKLGIAGRKSNRQGIGARLTAVVNGRKLVRELYPHNSFSSAAPNIVHFGLGDADRVEQLTIRWPSGKVQDLHNLGADRHIIVDEGEDGPAAVTTVVPGQTIRP
jgi:hypothetical protein